MSSNVANNVPYLPTTRDIPTQDVSLKNEMTKIYTDIATAVNTRDISLYDLAPIITGQQWFTTATQQNAIQKRQAFRQVFTFTAAGNITHNIANITVITPLSYGQYTDGTNWYGAIFASSTAIAAQVSFYVTPTLIVVLRDAGAPTISSGIIVLEWLAN